MKVVSIKCPGCGASLAIPPDVDQCGCSYCGTSLTVIREGGIISLREISAGIARVEETTSQTADELYNMSSELADMSGKLDDIHRRTAPAPTYTESESSGPGCGWVAYSIFMVIFGLAAIAGISGTSWALFWSPFLIWLMWANGNALGYKPSSLWTKKQKSINTFFVLLMIAAVLVKCV